MKFHWTAQCNYNRICNININVRRHYRKIAQKFCEYYYFIYDTNPFNLKKFYTPHSIFMYINEELTGFDAVYGKMLACNMHKFTHHSANVSAIPIDNGSILINVNGTLSVNNSIESVQYIETILLKRSYGNKFFILNTIFKINKPPIFNMWDFDRYDDMMIDDYYF